MGVPRAALLAGLAVLAAAIYIQRWGVPDPRRYLLSEQDIQARLAVAATPTTSTFMLILGRAFFVVGAGALAVLSCQNLAAAIQRALYVPVGTPPLAPAPLEQQAAAGTDATAAPPAARAATAPRAQQPGNASSTPAAGKPAARPPPPQQQQGQDPRDLARMRALEAAQRALDEQTAAIKARKQEVEAQRLALREQAAAQKARADAAQAAAAAARHAAAEADQQQRRQAWNEAVQQQWRGLEAPGADDGGGPAASAAGGAAGGSSSGRPGGSATPPAAAAAAAAAPSPSSAASAATAAGAGLGAGLEAERSLKAQQDAEYEASLASDAARATHQATARAAAKTQDRARQQQQRLATLRVSLQDGLGPEPPAAAGGDGDAGGAGTLSLRVRLPDGSAASRRFARDQGYEEVLAWVFSLPGMPLCPPGSWGLASTFPRQLLAAPHGSLWTPEGWCAQQQEEGADVLVPGQWMLEVRQLTGQALYVRASPTATVLDIKEEVETQTGLAPHQQRLIFGGHVLSGNADQLGALNITPGHTLQLAPRLSSAGSSSSSLARHSSRAEEGEASASGSSGGGAADGGGGGGGGGAAAGAEAKAGAGVGGGDGTAGSVLVVATVAELQDKVAAGAQQLTLFVQGDVQ